ncbi:SusC/RagA family TonB-linked outer membrane protein [Maribellus comscasis]|nr:TonB-dependent receptor [Maribellus comscasis]
MKKKEPRLKIGETGFRFINFFFFWNLFFVFMLFSASIFAQGTKTITGTVADLLGQPLPGATVVEQGTTNGTVTNSDGFYTINVNENATLAFSFVGMKPQIAKVGNQNQINIMLEEESIGLEEVVAIGYGTQSRKTLTTAISKYETEELNNIAVNNVADGLKGKVAGVRVYSSSGQPGETPSIRIRGGSSINYSNSPLILIDGLERGLDEVNPKDIESIEVLKDAAATAIYGSRASNGVVLVTTKKGDTSGAPKITFESTLSYQNIERYYDLCNAEEYLTLERLGIERGPNASWNSTYGYGASTNNDENSIYTTRYLETGETVPSGWKTMPDPVDPSKTLVFQDNDFADIIFNPTLRQNYYIGASGGTNALKYAGGISYTDDKGVSIGTGWKQFSARANTSINLSEKVKLSTSFDFHENTSEAYDSQVNAITRALYSAPTQRLYNDDGTPTRGFNATSPNPLWWEYYHDGSTIKQGFNVAATLDWNITKHLLATFSGNKNTLTSQSDTFEKANEFNGSRPAESSFSQTRKEQLEGVLNYSNSLGKNNFQGMVGLSYLDVRYKYLYAYAYGGSTDKISTLNAAPTAGDATSTKTEDVLIGYFARLAYDYDKKYLLSASVRRDGSSRFGDNKKWALFPSVSLGWIITEEDFMKNQNTISTLKLRSSLGQTGNNAISLNAAQGVYSPTYKYNGNAGIRNTSMANQDLTWETTTQYDLGLDAGLFKNRLTFLIDGFNKKTDDLLFAKELPNTSGFSSITTNIGTVRYYGFDFQISSTNIKKNDFTWSTDFTWSYVKNKVVKLPDNGRDKNRIGGYQLPDGSAFGGIAEGEPLDRFYGFKVDYLIDNFEQAENALYDQYAVGYDYRDGTTVKGRKMPGDYEWIDRNGDGEITSVDVFELGRTTPHTTGGLNNTVKYKNFTFRLFLDWAMGHSMMDVGFKYHMMSTFNSNANPVTQALDAWKEEGDAAKTKWARFAPHDSKENWNYRRDSDAVTFKGDYLCIREISVAYDIPSKLLKRTGFKNANIFISGNNLHYFTEVLATPPEVSTNNYSSSTGYPPVRRINFGIKVTY